MAHGDITGQTLYAEVTAGQGTGIRHASSGQTLQTLRFTVAGNTYAHASAQCTLPSLQGSGSMSKDAHASGSPRLPHPLVSTTRTGLKVKDTLPTLRGGGTGTNTIVANGACTLPSLTGAGTALAGYTMSGAGVLLALTGVGYSGARGVCTLPKLTGTGAGRYESHALAANILPKLQGLGVGHRSVDSARGACILPKLIAGQAVRVTCLLPKLRAAGTAQNGAALVTQAWAMNTSKGQMTQFTNFPFRCFVRFKDRHYGLGFDGNMYLLGGDTDATVPIAWQFKTGKSDLDSAAQKGIKGVYVDGVIGKGAELTIDTDTGSYVYDMHSPTNALDHSTYRIVTGRGIRTRNITLGMRSSIGNYCEVDSIAPKYDISKRNI